jgi:hypothetical protein
MGIQLDEHAYQKLIDENIEALNKYMPEHSLEKKHTIEVLKWSVQQIYHRGKAKPIHDASALPIHSVMYAVCPKCKNPEAIALDGGRLVDCHECCWIGRTDT